MSNIVASLRGSQQRVVTVVETDAHRFLLREETIVGCEHQNAAARDQIAFAGMALMATIAFSLPTPQNVLCLGLGAGTVPHYLRTTANIRTDVVEIDEAVIRLAEEHFLFGTSAKRRQVIHADALQMIAAGPSDTSGDGRYDVVLSDMWSGGNEGAGLTLPFFSRVRDVWLRDGGVLAINLVAFIDGPYIKLAVDVVRTLREAFDHVAVFAESDPLDGEYDYTLEPLNLLLLGSSRPLQHAPPTLDESPDAGSMEELMTEFGKWRPARLDAAAAGVEGTVLMGAAEWEALSREASEAARGMRAQQQGLLPEDAWVAVSALLEEAEESPPRRIARAPSQPTSKEEL